MRLELASRPWKPEKQPDQSEAFEKEVKPELMGTSMNMLAHAKPLNPSKCELSATCLAFPTRWTVSAQVARLVTK